MRPKKHKVLFSAEDSFVEEKLAIHSVSAGTTYARRFQDTRNYTLSIVWRVFVSGMHRTDHISGHDLREALTVLLYQLEAKSFSALTRCVNTGRN